MQEVFHLCALVLLEHISIFLTKKKSYKKNVEDCVWFPSDSISDWLKKILHSERFLKYT